MATTTLRTPRPPTRGVRHFEHYEDAPNALSCVKGGRLANSPTRVTQCGLVSIITVVRNGVETLSRTIDSIKTQSYRHIEYLVVDGNSTDGTLELLRQREADIDLWLSEPDLGISDAFNKGIALSCGEFVALVNADDWLEPEHIRISVECLNRSGADFSFGNLVIHAATGAALYSITGDAHYARRLHHAMPAINHPTIVCRRMLYARNGLYDIHYRIAMDYEWLLRNHLRGAVGSYIPHLTGHMGAAGVSQRHIHTSLMEVRRASISHGYPVVFAHLRYQLRLLRAHARVLLEWWLPHRFVDAVHRLLNRSYRGAPVDSSTCN
jgi:glycosyltransferase involved in cell wall biosynthesis